MIRAPVLAAAAVVMGGLVGGCAVGNDTGRQFIGRVASMSGRRYVIITRNFFTDEVNYSVHARHEGATRLSNIWPPESVSNSDVSQEAAAAVDTARADDEIDKGAVDFGPSEVRVCDDRLAVVIVPEALRDHVDPWALILIEKGGSIRWRLRLWALFDKRTEGHEFQYTTHALIWLRSVAVDEARGEVLVEGVGGSRKRVSLEDGRVTRWGGD